MPLKKIVLYFGLFGFLGKFGLYMKVTARQKSILSKLMDIYQENKNCPVHYSMVAKRLGISKWSAYDMMRVLEGKGLVAAHYELAEEIKARGRTSVYFSPTKEAHKMIEDLVGGNISSQNWKKVKQDILNKLDRLKEKDKVKLLNSLLGILKNE
jgi:predicted ArsR family transcriptional regulator